MTRCCGCKFGEGKFGEVREDKFSEVREGEFGEGYVKTDFLPSLFPFLTPFSFHLPLPFFSPFHFPPTHLSLFFLSSFTLSSFFPSFHLSFYPSLPSLP